MSTDADEKYKMSRRDQAREIFAALHRQFPLWPCTFSTCRKCGAHPARGSGPCVYCLEAELAKLVGDMRAAEVVDALLKVSCVWGEICEELKE